MEPSQTDPYRACKLYVASGACYCSTGIPGEPCPLAALSEKDADNG
jgi:hypothetical protein